jgi:hypothetical protein
MPRQFIARQKQEAWDRARALDVRETAEAMIDDRGAKNAFTFAEHCMTRDPSHGFWRAVRDLIALQLAQS